MDSKIENTCKVFHVYIIMSKQKQFSIAACFDTETSNIKYYDKDGNELSNKTRAICICYMFNDLRMVDLKKYVPGKSDKVTFIRYENEAQEYIDKIVDWGLKANVIPIIAAYNLMFDMQTLMYELNRRYDMKANAQSSTNVYTLDLQRDGETVLRFWDTYHLEMRGLAAMGETCGLAKAKGDWDYSKIRTPETPLTEEEIFYATRDVQVIPAYLQYLLNANDWLRQTDLGCRVLTKTSLVRQMAQRKIGQTKITKRNGKQLTLMKAFESMCKRQLPRSYEQYAIRKACFRGGWTFTSGKCASRVVENVASLDVTSMHHAFINGRYVPIDFDMICDEELKRLYIEHVLNTTFDDVLNRYWKPFDVAFHMEIQFENIRLKKGSCFDEWQIALIPMGKFRTIIAEGAEYGLDERARLSEETTRNAGFHDTCRSPKFAFGKLYSADMCTLFVSELELWCISRVYEWDTILPLRTEGTVKWKRPPDFVTLQSNNLFEMKNDVKRINNGYIQGTPYEAEIPNTIPPGIAELLKRGECDSEFFNSFYNSTVKGMFNGIYGTQAQDVFKPDYAVRDGELFVDRETAVTAENFYDKIPSRCKVLYTYGLRIVGGSRMHLVMAMELLFREFGQRINVCGGDTDSLKLQLDRNVDNDSIFHALNPLHRAIKNAIDYTMIRVRKLYPDLASDLKGIGTFDREKCGGFDTWKYHLEAWNKARISISQDNKVHVTCAGLSRPIGEYHIENFVTDLIEQGNDIRELLPNVLGYNVYVTHELCFALEHYVPKANDIFDDVVTDYLGNSFQCCQPEAISLYESGRMLGDTNKRTNADNVRYLRERGVYINDDEKWLRMKDGKPQIVNVMKVLYGEGEF